MSTPSTLVTRIFSLPDAFMTDFAHVTDGVTG